jgi:hypothetical protein
MGAREDRAVGQPTTITQVRLSSRANGEEKMIREFLGFVVLVFGVVGVLSWWVWFKDHSNLQAEPQPIDRHEGSMPDSFFELRTSDPPKERKSELLPARKNKCEFRR